MSNHRKGKGRRKKNIDDDDEAFDFPSQQVAKRGNKRQRNSSQTAQVSPVTKANITDEERTKLISDLMRFILFMDGTKHPVSRTEILSKTALKDYKDKKNTTQILNEAKEKFKYIFGYDLIELPKVTDSSAPKKKSTAGSYILKNTLGTDLRDKLVPFSEKQTEMGFIMIVLGIIELTGRPVPEDSLFGLLKLIGFNDSELHPVFGDWKKLLELKFTKEQKYFQRNKTSEMKNDQYIHEYTLGPRALEEIDRRNVREFLNTVFGDGVLGDIEDEEKEQEEEEEGEATQSQE